MKAQKLIPTVGFGQVRFGMTIDEVEQLLGKPDEKFDEMLGDAPDDLSTQLIYEELGLSLSFDKAVNFRLVDIMTQDDDSPVTLGDDIRLGDTYDKVLAATQKADWGPMEEHDIEDDLDEDGLDDGEKEEARSLTEYELPEVSVVLWFKGGRLDTIQIGPEYDEDDNILWPRR